VTGWSALASIFHPPILTSTRNDVITAIIIIIHVHGSPEVLAEVGG